MEDIGINFLIQSTADNKTMGDVNVMRLLVVNSDVNSGSDDASDPDSGYSLFGFSHVFYRVSCVP